MGNAEFRENLICYRCVCERVSGCVCVCQLGMCGFDFLTLIAFRPDLSSFRKEYMLKKKQKNPKPSQNNALGHLPSFI